MLAFLISAWLAYVEAGWHQCSLSWGVIHLLLLCAARYFPDAQVSIYCAGWIVATSRWICQKNFEARPCTFWRKYKAVFVFCASLTGFKHVESFLFHMISMSSHEWTCFSQISMSCQECTRAAMVIRITICVNFSLVNFMLSLSFWLVFV